MQVASLQLEAITPTAEAAIVTQLPQSELFPRELPTVQENPSDDLKAYATKVAKEHGLNVNRFLNVIACESRWKPSAVGDQGNSFGLLQIHLPSHPTVKKSQALDPYFSIEWAADRWVEGDAWMWTCWRKMYG